MAHDKTKEKQNVLRIVLPVMALVLSLLLCLAAYFCLSYRKNAELLATGSYNAVFLSTFPIETFQAEDFSHFRGDQVVMVQTKSSDFRVIRRYLSKVLESGNCVRVIYLGIDPEVITARDILEWKAAFPDTQFEILPKWRSLTQWVRESDDSSALASYRSLVEGLMEVENLRVFSFFAQPWIIADPESYVKGTLLTESIAHLVYLYTDELHGADFSPELIEPVFAGLEHLIRDEKAGRNADPDLSDWDMVFFGDSVIGNYNDYHAITQLVSHFSGARTYNCGQGGSTASTKTLDIPDLGEVVEAYLTGDLSSLPEGSQVYSGLSQRLADERDGTAQGRRLLFVLHYGINDYIQAHPLRGQDPMDPETFTGALRSSINKIRSARPDARILLIVPNTLIYLNNGEEPTGFMGSSYALYQEAVSQIAEEYGLLLLDDSKIVSGPGIRGLLSDEIHPNENGRYLITRALLSLLSSSAVED